MCLVHHSSDQKNHSNIIFKPKYPKVPKGPELGKKQPM